MTIDPVSLAITAALTLANMALTASQTIEGPRLDSTKFTSGDYGAPLPLVWGKRRLECPIFWAEDLKEVKRRRKTKGGKYNEYTYYGTWAVALAGHEITAVTRVWFDTHLVFDLTGAGPITPFDFGDDGYKAHGFAETLRGTAGGNGQQSFLNDHLSIYFGTEDQEPDPRIQATTEAKFGEGSCPAYRGTSYAAMKDVPLEKLGNRIPQTSFEFTSNHTAAFPSRVLENAAPTPLSYFLSADRSIFYICDASGHYNIVDLASRSAMVGGTIPNGVMVTSADSEGRLWGLDQVAPAQDRVVSIAGDGTTLSGYTSNGLTWPDGSDQEGQETFAFMYGDKPFIGISPLNTRNNLLFYRPINAEDHAFTSIYPEARSGGATWSPKYFAQDTDGDVWAGGTLAGYDTFTLLNVTGNEAFTVSMPTTLGAGTWIIAFRHFQDATHDHFIVNWPNYLVIIDRQTGAVIDTVAYSDDANVPFRNCAPTASSWFQYDSQNSVREVSAIDGSVLRVLNLEAWVPGATANQGIYDPVNHAWIGIFESDLTWYFLDRLSGDGVPLATVANDLADLVDIEDYDFTPWTDVVNWSMTQGQAKNGLDPLLTMYDCDIGPHDFAIRGIKRTGIAAGTISVSAFAKSDPRYGVKIRQAAELPRANLVTFADTAADQQPNTARADRPLDTMGARGERSIDMSTWATDVDEARQRADALLRWDWNTRREVTNGLTAKYLAIEPGDCTTLTLDGESDAYNLRKAILQSDGIIACQWTWDHPSLHGLNGGTGAGFDGREPAVIAVPMISKAILIDGPYFSDSDAQTPPTIYALAGPYGPGSWPGAVIYEAVDGDYSQEVGSLSSTDRMTWGYVDEAFDWTNPNVWDRGTVLTVRMKSGSLTGTTEAACLADASLNLTAIGGEGRWEYVQFTTAELIDTDVYEVSGFRRGRRGTEWAAELHAAGDVFVLVENATEITMGLSDVGTDESFKAITGGRSEAGAFPVYVSPFTGASLKPLAPACLRAVQDGSTGDWALSWVRRTRLGGAWVGGTPIPLAEASEAYEVDILNDAGAVVRTYDGLTAPEVAYPAADQIEDFGVVVGSFDWRAYQISDAVGRGFAGKGSASGGLEAVGAVFSTQWRIRLPLGAQNSSFHVALYEVEMASRYGGPDLCDSAVATASSERDGSHTAPLAIDNNPDVTSRWQPNVTGVTESWWLATFPEPVHVSQLRVYSVSIVAPKQIVLEAWDGAAFDTEFDSGSIASWADETKTFNIT